jgi:hypothetical protein
MVKETIFIQIFLNMKEILKMIKNMVKDCTLQKIMFNKYMVYGNKTDYMDK